MNETADPQTPYVVTEKRSSVETLLEIVKTQADTIKQHQETIHFLTTNQGMSLAALLPPPCSLEAAEVKNLNYLTDDRLPEDL